MNKTILSNGDIQLGDYKYRMDQSYVTLNYVLNKYCNFRCDHCVSWNNESRNGIIDKYPTKKIVDSLVYLQESSGKKLYVILTGGEPSLVLNFSKFVQQLTNYMPVGIQTNLCTAGIGDMAKNVSPKRIVQIEAAYHGEILNRDKKLQSMYFDHFRILKEKGFSIVLKIVAVPEELDYLEEKILWLRKQLPKNSLIFVQPYITLLPGTKQHLNSYPYCYTEQEKVILARLMTVRKTELLDYINGAGWFCGMKCGAGQRYLVMDENGNVFRCTALREISQGNLIKRNIQFLTKPTPCSVTTLHD